MRHYSARQRISDGRWDYCCGSHPIGYCCEYVPLEVGKYGATERDVEKCEATKEKHHTDGHATRQEACDCYLEYLLDHRTRVSKASDSQHKCQECAAWTQGLVFVGECRSITLCEDHQDRDMIKKHFGRVGEMWIS